MQKEKNKSMLQQYYDIKRILDIPLKVRLYFSTLQGLLDKNQNNEMSKQQIVGLSFTRTFQKQSEQQKICYLLYMMKSLQSYYAKNDEQKHEQNEQKVSTINNIETSCRMEMFSFRLPYWTTCKFKFDKLKRNILIINKKKNITVNLKHYLVRRSKKNTFTIVFEGIHKDISLDNQKISLQFKQEIYEVVYMEILEVISDNIKESLVLMARQNYLPTEEFDAIEKPNPFDQSPDKSFAFLTSEQIKNYLLFKSQILQRLQVGGFSFKSLYNKQNKGEEVRIERSAKIDKIFKLECLIERPKEQIKAQFLQAINSKYKYKVLTNVLEQFSKKYRAVYDKYVISGKIHQQICIKQESNSEKEEIYFSKGMENVLTGNYLQFLIAKVKPTEDPKLSKLTVVASLVLSKDITLDVAISFLLEFREMLDKRQDSVAKEDTDDDEFFSIVQFGNQNIYDYEIDSDEGRTDRNEMAHNELAKKEKSLYSHSYLTHRFVLEAVELGAEAEGKKLKKHFFDGVWGREKRGGIVCISQEMNTEQRNVIKKIVANLGSNLYKIIKSGNFMNCSLPLGIFKKASHLELIGNNLAYAPVLFDRFHRQPIVDAVERFKYTILFNISVSNLGISLQKPFNPILGETLQCWVGGCPLYLQQISHHPPISSYLLEGRGYRIHGCIDPKISLGLNSLSCWSERHNYIEFEDGAKVCLAFGKMLMSGFIFGSRQFNYEDRTYLYDMTNHLFCLLHFGPKKKGTPKNEAVDFVHGKVYRLLPSFLPLFLSKIQPYPEKKDIESELSSFEGIWNEAITFDGQEYINFSTELPYSMEKEQFPLPSNYSFRKDLSYYLEGDVQKAQEQKEALEESQRRDRRLREKHAH